ncbi:hypothetical protein BV22DRAFT_120838 [Leucogyrophana mollusca]|uniref:Uncharacterized protein n=1 Tax=Leucogyrophana mollusca TaxID=85980 RepID=A0ACB8BUA2_9AGAM|nr:hypothetical protein BV22DRAFT_120838 [Leucogyrophana mollusca]
MDIQPDVSSAFNEIGGFPVTSSELDAVVVGPRLVAVSGNSMPNEPLHELWIVDTRTYQQYHVPPRILSDTMLTASFGSFRALHVYSISTSTHFLIFRSFLTEDLDRKGFVAVFPIPPPGPLKEGSLPLDPCYEGECPGLIV